MTRKIRPIGDRTVLADRDQAQRKGTGLILRPVSWDKATGGWCQVVAMPAFKSGKRIPTDFGVGDLVFIGQYERTDMMWENELIYIIRQGQVLLVRDDVHGVEVGA